MRPWETMRVSVHRIIIVACALAVASTVAVSLTVPQFVGLWVSALGATVLLSRGAIRRSLDQASTSARMRAVGPDLAADGGMRARIDAYDRAFIESEARLCSWLAEMMPSDLLTALVGSGHETEQLSLLRRRLISWQRDLAAVRAGRRGPFIELPGSLLREYERLDAERVALLQRAAALGAPWRRADTATDALDQAERAESSGVADAGARWASRGDAPVGAPAA